MPTDALVPARAPAVPGAGLVRRVADTVLPVAAVTAALLAVWLAAVYLLNAPVQRDAFERAGTAYTAADLFAATYAMERPVLPSPHQVVAELWKTTVATPVTSKRSLVYHGWITLSSTLLGFAMGTLLGILLAVLVVHSRTLDKSLMPWVVSSQTIPIIAIAPMIIVVLNAVGLTGLLPKAFISTYLSFFPVTVGVVTGLRSPERLHLDLMRTWSATPGQMFWKLRLPAAMPFLFTSMKVAIAASLVGAIVGELPTGAVAGLGARLLAGSYYGQTVQIWAALVAAAIMAAMLVALVGVADRAVRRRMGIAP